MKLGIALYTQPVDYRGRATSPDWALVAHPTSYAALDVQVFQVRQHGAGSWVLSHTVCALLNAPTIIGVIHIADINMTPANLDAFIRPFPATKSNDDPSGNIVWSCSNWVIRILHYLNTNNALRLPWKITSFYDRTLPRIEVLKSTPKTPGVLLVIPLVG